MVTPTTSVVNSNLDTIQLLSHLKLENGDTPAHYAVRQHNKELLQKVLKAGFSITEKNNDGLSALDLAIISNQNELAALMLQHTLGIDPQNLTDLLDRRTIVSGLVSIEKSIHEWKGKCGQTAKMTIAAMAALKGDVEALKEMDPALLKQPDLNGLTPLHYALINGQENAASFLIPHSDAAFLIEGNSYLHFAAMSGNPKMVQLVLSMGIDVNAPNAQGLTPAHFLAATCASPTDLIFFAKNGASLMAQSPSHLAPIGLLFAKAIQKEPELLSSKDKWLAFSQALNVALFAGFAYQLRAASIPNFSSLLAMGTGFLVNLFAKQWIVSSLPPAQQNQFLSRCTRPAGIAVNSLIVTPIGSAGLAYLSDAYVIAKNSITGLGRCLSSWWAKPASSLGAASVHLFNLGAEALPWFITGSILQGSSTMFQKVAKFLEGDQRSLYCPMPDGFSQLSRDEQLKTLNPQCLNHATEILAPTGDISCENYRKLYHALSLLYHRDKGGSDEMFRNIGGAYETVKAYCGS
jgi:ankyrin repeat protein